MQLRLVAAVVGTLAVALAPHVAHAQSGDTIDKAKSTGVVTLGVRQSSGALSYALGDGQFGGFHVELCQRIVEDIEKAAGRKLEVRYALVSSESRMGDLTSGKIDMSCGSATNTTARQQEVGFLNTTFVEEARIAVKANSGIQTITQLHGKTLVTTRGTTTVQHLRRHERGAGIKFKPLYGKDHDDSFRLLATGKADAFLMDRSILAGNIAKSANPADFTIVDEPLSLEPIAIMIRKDDAGLKKLGNETIARLVSSGEMAKLWDKWFMQPIPPGNVRVGLPLSDATKAAWADPNDKPMEQYRRR